MANEEQILIPMTYDYFHMHLQHRIYRKIQKYQEIGLELARQKEKDNSTDCRAKKWGSSFLIHLVR